MLLKEFLRASSGFDGGIMWRVTELYSNAAPSLLKGSGQRNGWSGITPSGAWAVYGVPGLVLEAVFGRPGSF
jgi:hypothetical protein